MRAPVRGPVRGLVRGPVRGLVRGLVRGPVRGLVRGPVRAPATLAMLFSPARILSPPRNSSPLHSQTGSQRASRGPQEASVHATLTSWRRTALARVASAALIESSDARHSSAMSLPRVAAPSRHSSRATARALAMRASARRRRLRRRGSQSSLVWRRRRRRRRRRTKGPLGEDSGGRNHSGEE